MYDNLIITKDETISFYHSYNKGFLSIFIINYETPQTTYLVTYKTFESAYNMYGVFSLQLTKPTMKFKIVLT